MGRLAPLHEIPDDDGGESDASSAAPPEAAPPPRRAVSRLPEALQGRGHIHPALHVDASGVVLGWMTAARGYQLVTSERSVYGAEAAKPALAFAPRPYPDLLDRWPEVDVAAFVSEDSGVTFADLFTRCVREATRAVEFPRPEQPTLVAAWSIATYFHPVFLTFPRLALSGERESGKSKVLAFLQATAFNALLMLNPTPAVLFRLIQEFRPTLLLDEMEGLSKEDARDVLGIINSGYKAGGTVARCEGQDRKRVESFAVYGPLALAAIKAVNETTQDRSIPLVLIRGADRRRVNAEVDPSADAFTRIRCACHRLLLTRWADVQSAYASAGLPGWLNGRARELWRPLLAVATVADQDAGRARFVPDLLALARDHVREREDVSSEIEALLVVLAELLGDATSIVVRPGSLRRPLTKHLGWDDAPTAKRVSEWLRRLGFPRGGRDREGAWYEIPKEYLLERANRFGVSDLVDDGSES